MYESNEDLGAVIHECKQCQAFIYNVVNSNALTKHENSRAEMVVGLRKLVSDMRYSASCIDYTSLNKMLAVCCLMDDEEIPAIYHLIESHAVTLRIQAQHRFHKTQERERFLDEPQVYGLNPSHFRFDVSNYVDECGPLLKTKLSELPDEWYMIQLTSQYQPPANTKYNDPEATFMHPIHISILPTGKKTIQPFCITVPKPNTNMDYDVCKEIHEILANNKSDLEASYANNQFYWKMRERQNNKMKAAITELEATWLREWRILFMADPIENLELVEDVQNMISKLVTDDNSTNEISERSKWLLEKIVLGACFLTKAEIAMAVKYVLPLHEKLSGNIILSIYGKLNCLNPLISAKRKTLVLIIDENMDYIPFESIEVLQNHPVTRFPSLHIAYALFKEHQETIEEGCKVIQIGKNNGSFIVNPSGTLPNMEKRMKLFIDYWLPHWTGSYNVEPDEKSFERAFTNYNILMYNGHGSGIQYLSGERIEKLRVKALVLLFGCGSVKLLPVGGRFPPYGVSNQYLIACSPCVLGMLWEVTDADVDKMTASFISDWIPSSASRPWSDVNINKWSNGVFEFKNEEDESQSRRNMCHVSVEPEMLRAIAKSRGACSQYMTAAAVVVRGLPIKLK